MTDHEVCGFFLPTFKDGQIGIFDTKSGNTAANPEGREKGLNERIAAMNEAAGGEVFVGGLVVKVNACGTVTTARCHQTIVTTSKISIEVFRLYAVLYSRSCKTPVRDFAGVA